MAPHPTSDSTTPPVPNSTLRPWNGGFKQKPAKQGIPKKPFLNSLSHEAAVPAPDPRPCPRNTHNADVPDFICEEEHHKRKSAYLHRSFSSCSIPQASLLAFARFY